MALTPAVSSQYASYSADPSVRQNGADWGANLEVSRATLVMTASGTGTAIIAVLPAGRKLVYPHLSCVTAPDGATSADLDVGHGGYTVPAQPGGVAEDVVVADVDAFAASLDLGGGPFTNQAFNIASPVVVDSKGEVLVTASIDTANGLTGTYEFVIVYAKAGS